MIWDRLRERVLALAGEVSAFAAAGWWYLRTVRRREIPGGERVVYREVGGREIALHVFRPSPAEGVGVSTALLFFHGGGWVQGRPAEMAPHCKRLAARRTVAMTAEYRLVGRGAETPADSVDDACAALRYVVRNADRLGIDPKRVVLLGASAGAHLAAMTAIRATDDGPHPAAVVLMSGVLDTTERGWGHELLGEAAVTLSPVHQIRPGFPDALVAHGTDDPLTPYENATRFAATLREAGTTVRLVTFSGVGHGLYKPRRRAQYERALKAIADYLVSLGLLDAE